MTTIAFRFRVLIAGRRDNGKTYAFFVKQKKNLKYVAPQPA
jgi:hypothetical protein